MTRSQLTGFVAMLLITGMLVSQLGCEEDSSKGGLVVVLESDLASPKDIDRIHFEILRSGKLVRGQDFMLGEGATLLPLEVEVPSPGDDGPVTVQGTAYKGEFARIERHAITPVPREHFALLRMPFHYLCSGSANRDGTSSCPDGLTCKRGECADASLDPSQLTRVERDGTSTRGSAILGADDEAGAGTCFDVLACFANAAVVELDLETCSFGVDETVPREAINVALALPPGADGICDSEGCWVALSPGEDGWSFDRGEIQLPESLCEPIPDADPPAVAVSLACASKPPVVPPCGAWSSQREPIPPLPANVLPPDAIGEACSGRATRPCGQCGVSQRMCRNGNWQAWSECADEGICAPGSSQVCGGDGSQICGDNCEWSECTGQSCDGPTSEACGDCGTRTRECTNGSWSDWTECGGQGVCAPDQVEACGTGGNRACTGSCQWGACTDQSCPGSPTQACAMCGTQSRECNEDTGDWSEFGQCDGQGACEPGDTQPCGNGGTRTCGGDCQWAELCSGQSCRGATMEACGNCGIRTRGCDRNTGMPTDWSACTDQGDCEPGTQVSCGNGSRTCSDRCEWSECSGCPDGLIDCPGACVAASSANCGACGLTCGDGESCQDGDCLCNDGLSACGNACVDLSTDTENCGDCDNRCGDRQRCQEGRCVCPRGTEEVQGDCVNPCAQAEMRCGEACVSVLSDPAHCGGCDVRCAGGEACRRGTCTPLITPMRMDAGLCDTCGGRCVDFLTDPEHCGACDVACDDGQECLRGSCSTVCVAPLMLCDGECTDLTTSTGHCGACSDACGDGQNCVEGQCRDICSEPRALCGDSCVDLLSDAAHCGECNQACEDGQECLQGDCSTPCAEPASLCGDSCVDLLSDAAHCGECNEACGDAQECFRGRCRDVCREPEMLCGGECTDVTTDVSHCGTCDNACDRGVRCSEGECVGSPCEDGLSECNGECVDLQRDRVHCGECGRVCAGGDVCRDGVCILG